MHIGTYLVAYGDGILMMLCWEHIMVLVCACGVNVSTICCFVGLLLQRITYGLNIIDRPLARTTAVPSRTASSMSARSSAAQCGLGIGVYKHVQLICITYQIYYIYNAGNKRIYKAKTEKRKSLKESQKRRHSRIAQKVRFLRFAKNMRFCCFELRAMPKKRIFANQHMKITPSKRS